MIFSKCLDEMVAVTKSASESNFAYARIAFQEFFAGIGQTKRDEIFIRGHASGLFEPRIEKGGAHAALPG